MIWFVLKTQYSDDLRVTKVCESYSRDLEEGDELMTGDLELLANIIEERDNPVTVLYTTKNDEDILLESQEIKKAIHNRRLDLTEYFDTEDLELIENGKISNY